jgi:hypothetical protein
MSTPSGSTPRPRDLFTAFPATAHKTLIVRYPDRDDGRLAHCFADAAERLADSYRGSAPDDALLLPFLYLYRHAIELDLKYCITYATRLRRHQGHADLELVPAEVEARLHKKHGHRIMALLDELDRHMQALGVEKSPPDVRRIFTLLANTDPRGESFRYPGSLPQVQDHIDFEKLRAKLRDAYNVSSAAADVLSAVEDNYQDAAEEARYAAAEYAYDGAEEARELADELRRDFQEYY